MNKYKTFLYAFSFISEDVRKASRYLNDKRLSQIEKKILNANLLLRSNKFDEIIDSLNQIKSEDPLLESMRLVVIGSAYNNKGVMDLALNYMTEAYELIEGTDYQEQKFITVRNLFHVYFNIKHEEGIKKYFELLQGCERPSRFDDSFLLCELSYYAYMKDFKATKAILAHSEERFEHFNEFSKVYYLIMKLDLQAKADDMHGCRETLLRLKNHRNFFNTSNYKFIKTILDNLIDDAPIYVYDWDFHHGEITLWQLKVLAALESSSRAEALPFWNKLTALSPKTYSKDFEYCGDKCLFSICLEKHLNEADRVLNVPTGVTKTEQLISILTQAGAPVRKELIHELIWGECIQEKSDLKKLSRIVNLLKESHGFEIKSVKGSYHLLNPLSKKKKISN